MNFRQTTIKVGYSLIDIIKKIFGIKSPIVTDAQHIAMDEYVLKYEDFTRINNTRIAANKMAYITSFDSGIAIEGETPMAVFLRDLIEPYSKHGLNGIVSRMDGVGGVLFRPCTVKGEMHIDVLYQNQLVEYDPREKTAVIFIDYKTINNTTYLLYEYHQLHDNGDYQILLKAYDKTANIEVPLSKVPAWENATPEQIYTGVTQMLFGVSKCPTNYGGDYNSPYGVPMTFGQSYLDESILKLIETLNKEFALKKPRLAADDRAFEMDCNGNKLIDDQIKELLISQNGDMDNAFNIFSPTYQEDRIINAVNYLYSQYENGMGTSMGIFTQIESQGATATEIKSKMYETLCFIDANRLQLLKGFEGLVYACSVIASATGIVPYGEYEVVPYWDYSLFESSTEKRAAIIQGISVGAWGAEQLRMYELGEDLNTAMKNLPDLAEGVEVEEGINEKLNLNEVVNETEEVVGKTLNGAQTQSLITILGQLSQGIITEGQAINIISVAIGINKEEAKKIIDGAT